MEVEADIARSIEQMADALDQLRTQVKRLEREAMLDGLTGVYNRAYFNARLREEVVRAERHGLPLSLLLLDIDDFKGVNDRLGHVAGDQVLRKFASLMRAQLRRIDIPARYGGEEFAVILPQTAEDAAKLVADRIRHAAAGLDVPGRKGIGTSIGVASYPEHGTSSDSLVEAADTALYRAKRAGKDRVLSAGESVCTTPVQGACEPVIEAHGVGIEAHGVECQTPVSIGYDGNGMPACLWLGTRLCRIASMSPVPGGPSTRYRVVTDAGEYIIAAVNSGWALLDPKAPGLGGAPRVSSRGGQDGFFRPNDGRMDFDLLNGR